MKRIKILFLCRENACRFQMAEGIANYFYPEIIKRYSAGSHPLKVHPLAVKVMKEIGIEISSYKSKSVNEFIDKEFDYVITVCGGGKECPVFPGKAKKFLIWEIEDPAKTSEIEIFRKVRDEIRNKIDGFIKEIKE